MSQSHTILLLEDDNFDVLALQRALKRSALDAQLHVASDGEEALALLGLLEEPAAAAVAPDVAILDINVPRISGFDVCKQIRGHEATRALHVAFFSGSVSPQDEKQAFDAGANAYFNKNEGPEKLIEHLGECLGEGLG